MAFAALPAARGVHVDPVERAMAAAGGRDLLSRVRVLSWTASLRILLGKTPVDLMVETRMEPFVRVRSDTWLARDGRSTARTVMIEGDRGFIVHEGAQTAMPRAMAQLQREQFGAFGYLLLATVAWSDTGHGQITAQEPGFPEMRLTLGADGRVVSGDYTIASPSEDELPDTGAIVRPFRQQYRLLGTVMAQGIRFPRTTHIVEQGRLASTMTISDLTVELASAGK